MRLHGAECPHNIRGVGSNRRGDLLVTQPARSDVMHVVHKAPECGEGNSAGRYKRAPGS